LFRIATEKTTFTEAFSMADDVLYQGVKGVTDLMVRPGLINLDFADVRAVMDEMGKAMMGTGESDGEDRAIQSAEKAIANPLLDEISLRGARGVLINITGGYDLTLFELDEAANRIREEVDPEANIIVGSTLDPNLEGVMRVSVVATGIDAISKLNSISDSPREVSYYPPRKIIAAEERTVVNSQVAQGNSGQGMELKENISTTAPGLFESQNKLFRSEFDPTTAGGDNNKQPINAADRSRSSVSSEDQISIPQPTPPGTPSQQTLDRLRAAVSKSPNNQALSSKTVVAAKNIEVKEKPRFGIGSLINRMAGTNSAEPLQNEPPKAHPGISENKNNVETEEVDKYKEKIEVPAFLRRQAN
jgi:cell division protein FtsZ